MGEKTNMADRGAGSTTRDSASESHKQDHKN